MEITAGWTEYADSDDLQTLIMRAEGMLHANRQNVGSEARRVKVAVSFDGSAPNGDDRIAELSPRKRQVFDLLARGKVNKEIACALGATRRTAESYRASVMLKLEVHSVTELMIYAIRNGIVDAETI